MPDLDHIRAQTRRGFEAAGERIDLLKNTGSSFDPAATGLLAVVRGYSPEEMVGSIELGDVKVMVLADDLPDGVTPERNDRLEIGGAVYAIMDADPFSRRIQGETLVWVLQVRG